MAPLAAKGPGHFRCGCGAQIAVTGLPVKSDRHCPMTFKRGQCLRPKKSHEPVCDRCAVRIAELVLNSSKLCAQIADKQAAERFVEARSRAWAEQRARRVEAWKCLKQYGAHVVYYVQTRPGVVKIGTTSGLVGRIQGLRVQPEDVLAAEPGDRAVEKQRHAQFEALRIRKRWEDFTLTEELQAHIDAVAAQYGDPFEMAGQLSGLMRRMEDEDKLRRAEAEQVA